MKGIRFHQRARRLAMATLGCATALCAQTATAADVQGVVVTQAAAVDCPKFVCGENVRSTPNPLDGQGTAPEEWRKYVVKRFSVQVDDSVAGRPGVRATLCVQALPGAKVTHVYGVALLQPDVGAKPHLMPFAAALDKPLGPGQNACVSGTVRSPGMRPVLAPFYPAAASAR